MFVEQHSSLPFINRKKKAVTCVRYWQTLQPKAPTNINLYAFNWNNILYYTKPKACNLTHATRFYTGSWHHARTIRKSRSISFDDVARPIMMNNVLGSRGCGSPIDLRTTVWNYYKQGARLTVCSNHITAAVFKCRLCNLQYEIILLTINSYSQWIASFAYGETIVK